jgi:outer membrane protein, adhesin transport system
VRGEGSEAVRVFFEEGSASLSGATRAELERVALELMRPNRRALITGHSDAHGDDTKNERLSQVRAQRVARYLNGMGVRRDWVSVAADSAHAPVASNQTAQGRSQNRRVDVLVFRGAN